MYSNGGSGGDEEVAKLFLKISEYKQKLGKRVDELLNQKMFVEVGDALIRVESNVNLRNAKVRLSKSVDWNANVENLQKALETVIEELGKEQTRLLDNLRKKFSLERQSIQDKFIYDREVTEKKGFRNKKPDNLKNPSDQDFES